MRKCDDVFVVFVTCPTIVEARMIAKNCITNKLAACVNIVPVESHFQWKNELRQSNEQLLVMKAHKDRLEELEEKVTELHSYDTPEFIVLPVVSGSEKYLDWASEIP